MTAIPDLDRPRSSITDALGLFPSVIKSGEPWTGTCQTVLDGACAEYRTLKDRALKAEAERDAAREALALRSSERGE